jgi:hypothetical protein
MFKILSLHKYGYVNFFLNKTTNNDVADIMKGKKVDYKTFEFEGEKKNRLFLNSSHSLFCKGCLYILAVVAVKPTESSLFLGDGETKIPVSEEKVINDILPEVGSTTLGEFYPMEKGVLELKIHSGEISLQIKYRGDSVLQQTFDRNTEIMEYNFTINIPKGYYGTAEVLVTANKAGTVYSMKIRSAAEKRAEGENANYIKVNPNEANYVYIFNKDTCLQGYLKGRDEKLFLSFYQNQRDSIKKLKISGKLNGESSDVSYDITRNVMSLSFLKANIL